MRLTFFDDIEFRSMNGITSGITDQRRRFASQTKQIIFFRTRSLHVLLRYENRNNLDHRRRLLRSHKTKTEMNQ